MGKTAVVRFVALAAIVSLLAGVTVAGTLDAFEEDATRDRRSDDSTRRRDSVWDSDTMWGRLGADFVGSLIWVSLVAPGQASWARTAGDMDRLTEFDMEPRQPGDPLLPLVRFDFAHFDLQSNVEALDFRLQAGYGPFAVEINPTFYKEQAPAANLDLYRIWGLYRLTYHNRIEVNLGVGAIVLDGNETNTGFSYTTPVLVRPYDWLLLEFRPIWSEIKGSSIDEYEIGALLNWQNIAVKGGYRWTRSPNVSLNGPFFGLSIRY